jgi:hypothetical protein
VTIHATMASMPIYLLYRIGVLLISCIKNGSGFSAESLRFTFDFVNSRYPSRRSKFGPRIHGRWVRVFPNLAGLRKAISVPATVRLSERFADATLIESQSSGVSAPRVNPETSAEKHATGSPHHKKSVPPMRLIVDGLDPATPHFRHLWGHHVVGFSPVRTVAGALSDVMSVTSDPSTACRPHQRCAGT